MTLQEIHSGAADTNRTDPGRADLGQLVETALAASPDGCALRHMGTEMSRGALLEAALRVKQKLSTRSLSAGTPVILEIEHSFELVAGLCGVLMAGGAAVPVDPGLTDDRRQAIYRDIDPDFVLTVGADADIRIDMRKGSAGRKPGIAFIVYTSGSSGGPKGVEISQDGYVRRLTHIVAANPAGGSDVDLIWTPSSFIGLLDEIFFPLLQGIPAVIATPRERTDPRAFADLVARQRITTFRVTPSLLNVFLSATTADKLRNVRAIFCSGETISPDVQSKVHALIPASLIGFYGATEAPGVAYHLYDPTAPGIATTICTPQDFATFRVVDDSGAEVEKGAIGELWIGGFALAQGYWGKPALTSEKFITSGGARWYRTGDRGRVLDDNSIEVLGRADLSEVNILGVRVNIPEIRQALLDRADIEDAWISVVENTSGSDPVLVGHVVGRTGGSDDAAQDLKATLQDLLPAAAVPGFFLHHDQFDLTANGKLDVQSLAHEARRFIAKRQMTPAPSNRAPSGENISAMQTLLPVVIAVAEDTLGVAGLTGEDEFFRQGGNSLLAVQFAMALSERLGVELTSTLVFNAGSFGQVAQIIADGSADISPSLRLLSARTHHEPAIFTLNATGKYTALAAHLKTGSTVYNLNIFGLTNELIGVVETISLQDLASRLADRILETHPTGPWRLMAFCQDGCLAIEIGRILMARGTGVCGLLLIDTFFTDHRASLKMLALRALDFGPAYYVRKLKQKIIRKPVSAVSDDITLSQNAALIGKSRKDGQLYRRYTEFFMGYSPPAFDGPVLLFVSREWQHVRLDSVRKMAGDRLVVKKLPGLHNKLFAPDTIGALADAIDSALPEFSAQGT